MDKIEALKKLREVNGGRAHLWGKVLVIGLALEIVVLLAFAKGKSWKETAAGVFAALLVTVGVGLEIHFGKKAEEASLELQQISDEKIAEANAHAAEASLQAEKERLARVRLEARLAPRSIGPDSLDKMVDTLISCAGTVFTASVARDGEALSLLYTLVGAFERAGLVFHPWETLPRLETAYGAFGFSDMSDGVILHFPPATKGIRDAVLGAFVYSKLVEVVAIEDTENNFEGRLHLEVGKKPMRL